MLNNKLTKSVIIKTTCLVVFLVLFGMRHHKIYLSALHAAQCQHQIMQKACDSYGWESCKCKREKMLFDEAVEAKEDAQWWNGKPHN
jgi:hypothetical protein